VIHLTIPPLRERQQDVPLLLDHFLQRYAEHYGVDVPTLSPEVLTLLLEYSWPGNVRQLKNIVERIVVTQRRSIITPDDVPPELRHARRASTVALAQAPAAPSVVEQLHERLVKGGESFWTAVYAPFMSRDLTRDHLRQLVTRGLEETSGSYRSVVALFNMEPGDYKRFLNFLRKHQCHMPFQKFRALPTAQSDGQRAVGAGPVREPWKITA
jgi:DNA-binding NtrC family response regulator